MRALKWLIGIVVVLVVGVAAAFFLIPSERIVAVAAGQFEAQTGRTLSVGSVRPSLSPLGVAAKDIEISNADWSTRGPMVRAESLSVSVDIGSLFSGAPQIKGVTIDTPQILLERSADGAANWEFGSDEAGASDSSGSSGTAFTLDDLKVTDGRLTYAAPGQETVIEDLSLQTALKGADIPMVLDLAARVGGIPLAGVVQIARPGVFSDGGQSDLDATIELGAASASFGGTYVHSGDTILIGDNDLSIPSTGDLMVALGLPNPDLQPGFGQAVTARGPIEVAPTLISSAQSSISSGPTALSGGFAVDLSGEAPHLQADLSTGNLDLTSLAGEEEADGATGWSKDPLSAAGLDALNADVRLRADQLTYGETIMKDVSIDAALADGVLNTTINRMQAYGGAITGAFRVSGENSIAMSGSMNAEGVGLKEFMGDLFDFERIQGTGDVSAKFSGAGGSMHGLMNSLDGSGKINFGKGEILGFNLAGMLSNLDSAFGDSAASTIFNSITATFEIVDGVVTNVDLNLLAPLLEAVGEGTIGIGDQTMNYRVTPKLLQGDGTGFSVPVLITGSWSNLKFRPDLDGLLNLKADEAIKAVEEEVEEAVQKVEDDVKKKVEDELVKGCARLTGASAAGESPAERKG